MKYPLTREDISIEDVFLLLDTHRDLTICYVDDGDLCRKLKSFATRLKKRCQFVLVDEEILKHFKIDKVPTIVKYHKGVEVQRHVGTVASLPISFTNHNNATSLYQNNKSTEDIEVVFEHLRKFERTSILFYRSSRKLLLTYINQSWVQQDVGLIVQLTDEVQTHFSIKSDIAFVFYENGIPMRMNYLKLKHDQFLVEQAKAFGLLH